MAGELATSQRRLERSRVELERKNSELDERRRYIETVLERIATGVVSLGADGRVRPSTAAAAPARGRSRGIVGAPVDEVLAREDLLPLGALVGSVHGRRRRSRRRQEIALAREGREIHLAAAATALQGEAGAHEGAVLVFDDVTPLDPDAARRRVARRGAAARARDQEPADADSAVAPSGCAGTSAARPRRRARWSRSARRRSSARSSR